MVYLRVPTISRTAKGTFSQPSPAMISYQLIVDLRFRTDSDSSKRNCACKMRHASKWGKQANMIYAIFVFRFYCICGFYGFILFQNGELRSRDILQYFLDALWNFQNIDLFWTHRGPLHLFFIIKILQTIQETSWTHL